MFSPLPSFPPSVLSALSEELELLSVDGLVSAWALAVVVVTAALLLLLLLSVAVPLPLFLLLHAVRDSSIAAAAVIINIFFILYSPLQNVRTCFYIIVVLVLFFFTL